MLVAVWACCAALLVTHARVVRAYVEVLNNVGLAAGSGASTPRQQVIPARYADAQMWVRHAEAARAAGVARVRTTSVDNAPDGREVHWSSALAGLLRGAAVGQRAVAGESRTVPVEGVLWWFNVPLFFAVIVGLSAWAAMRLGPGAGAILAAAMVGHPGFYETFAPMYVDHHGLANAAVAGLVLGAVFMVGGHRGALVGGRRAAVFSAACGSVGLWLSAATVLPAIALVGVGGVLAGLGRGRGEVPAEGAFDGRAWRWWGRAGAAGSVLCYLFEYAPANFGLRLEVNHPLYALAWWGGAEVVALWGEWRAGQVAGRGVAGRAWLPLLAVAAPAAAIAGGGVAVFAVSDPFVGAMRHFVAEGMSLPALVRRFGMQAVAGEVAIAAAVLAPAAWRWRRSAEARAALLLAGCVALGFVAMGVAEMRWWTTAAAAQVVVLALCAGTIVNGETVRRWALIGAVAGCLMPAAYRVWQDAGENRRGAVAEGDLLQPLYRDIAAALRASQPEGDIVVLANPNASAGVSYFGDFKTLGTLYWENTAGLRAAAEIFCGPTEAAEGKMRARGVTHVVMIAQGNALGEYLQLLRPGAGERELKASFGYRLLMAPDNAPAWLQPIAFRRVPELASAGGALALFKVVTQQTEQERALHVARAQIARGDGARAEDTIERVARGLPATARAAWWETAGAAFLEHEADAAAVRMLRRSLDVKFDPEVANLLAWVLATSGDASVRDGRAALALIEGVGANAAGENPERWSTRAAALAAVGRFAEAVSAAERAVQLARASGDREVEDVLRARLESYRAGRVWQR